MRIWPSIRVVRRSLDGLIDELIEGRMFARQVGRDDPQPIPINIFETETELMIVAAAPGIEPADLDIVIEGTRLTIRAEKRGPGQERRQYIRREWTYGPYARTIELPKDIDADRANATYGNGVVTIALPRRAGRLPRRVEINMESVGTARGEHVGHRGKQG